MKENVALTPREVANILKIAKNTVYELIKRGELPAYRVGRNFRIDLKDVEAYKRQGKKVEVLAAASASSTPAVSLPTGALALAESVSVSQGMVICGQDPMLDILARHLERQAPEYRAFRYNVGSFSGLAALYQGRAHLSAIHLWDGDTEVYNIPYVRRLLPGIPTIIVHLACRMSGFYVAEGNPKKIRDWSDLTRPDVSFVNREKGCGIRVLLDEKLRKLGIEQRKIRGYEREELSHLAVASAVARGDANVGLGNEKTSLQVRNIDFIPLQKERYELVIKKEDVNQPGIQTVLEIIRSPEFKDELLGLGDYDLTETGTVVAEL
ncbi:MAG: helix-turn-helix transcriptional regulator [Syntrophomonadaceae bacterium]|jgi:putative molybdopterin biosynthesis protein|nr:helix-turn-helix transcriptional regulator [Syntrophomonadaceae bacterium]